MDITVREEMKNFKNKTPLMDRQGVYYLESQARQLAQLMDKYKKEHTPIIVHKLKPQLDDLIDDEIEKAIKAQNKNLKSKREYFTTASNKLTDIEREFLALFD